MSTPPKWYTPVAIAALLWNLLGCVAYLMDVMMKPEDVARLSAAQQELHASRAAWTVAAFAFAVWGGAAGSLGLLLRTRWAMPLLIVSLAGLIVQDFGLFVMTDAARLAGSVAFVLQGLVLAIAIGLVVLARTATQRGWIPKEVAQRE
jgi:hypothetical protein